MRMPTILGPRVLLQRVAAPTKTAGGIHLPDAAVPKTNHAKVIGVGQIAAHPIKVGDMVVYQPFAITPIKLGEEEYMIVHVEDLLMVL